MHASRRAPARSSKRFLLSGLAVIVLAMTAPAQAQFGYEQDAIMPPRAVAWRLSDRGFTEIARPRFDGRAYVVEASSPYGDRLRLFVDARDGAILGRQRLAPPPVRLVSRPSAPGYGWTEDDAERGRPGPQAGRLLPPGDIPYADSPRSPLAEPYPRQAPYPRQPARPRQEAVARPEPIDGNPTGVNPDARARPEPQRKAARLTPPAKPTAPRLTPEAPKPSEAEPPVRPDSPAAALEAPKAAAVPTPAAIQPPAPEKPAVAEAQASKEQTSKEQTWKDPPADAKRAVRVIGGATIVPGAGDKAPAAGEAASSN